MPTYTATYLTTYTFDVPKDVVLIKEEDLHKYQDEPGVWWVKWGTFYYIDKNGEQQEIQGDKSSDKWPDHMEEPEEVISKCFYCYRIGAWYRCSANDPFSDEPCACGVTIKTSAAMEAEAAKEAEELKNPLEVHLLDFPNVIIAAAAAAAAKCPGASMETIVASAAAAKLAAAAAAEEEEAEETDEQMKARGAMDSDGFVVCEHCGEGGGAHASEDCPHYEFVECCDTNCACAGHWYKKNPFEDDEDAIDYSKLNHIKTTPGGVEIYA